MNLSLKSLGYPSLAELETMGITPPQFNQGETYDGKICTCKETCPEDCAGDWGNDCDCKACGSRAAEQYADGQYDGVDFGR